MKKENAGNGKTRILFVCHGNICRSTMAEFVMKKKASDAGIADRLEIASAGTSDEELGQPVYYGTRDILNRHGIDCSGKRARQLTKADYERYDLLIGMDDANVATMRRKYKPDPDDKISLITSFLPPDAEFDIIDDPWYHRDFERTWREVNLCCDAILERLTD